MASVSLNNNHNKSKKFLYSTNKVRWIFEDGVYVCPTYISDLKIFKHQSSWHIHAYKIGRNGKVMRHEYETRYSNRTTCYSYSLQIHGLLLKIYSICERTLLSTLRVHSLVFASNKHTTRKNDAKFSNPPHVIRSRIRAIRFQRTFVMGQWKPRAYIHVTELCCPYQYRSSYVYAVVILELLLAHELDI